MNTYLVEEKKQGTEHVIFYLSCEKRGEKKMTDLFLQKETLDSAMETLKDTQGMTQLPTGWAVKRGTCQLLLQILFSSQKSKIIIIINLQILPDLYR